MVMRERTAAAAVAAAMLCVSLFADIPKPADAASGTTLFSAASVK
jgi:hypothetical protein